MVEYFRLDPTLSVECDQVYRWHEWSHRDGTHDTGIDLVARNKRSGEWTAIQCKFFDPTHSTPTVTLTRDTGRSRTGDADVAALLGSL